MRGFYYYLSFQGISCFSICLFAFQLTYAQPSYNMGDIDQVTDPEGFFYDSGGPSGNYASTGDTQTFTICPENTGCVVMDFQLFLTENPSNVSTGDVLTIYDGSDTNAPVIGVFSGALVDSDNAFGQVFAGSGCMTLEFTTNSSISVAGWEATWASYSNTCPTYSTLQPPVDCETAILICGEESLNYNSNGAGTEELLSQSIQGCITTGESQSAWFIVNISELAPFNIPLEFTISPKPGGVDYDFAVFGPIESCDELGLPVRCSYAEESTAGTLLTGLSNTELDLSESPTLDDKGDVANGFVKSIVTTPGETYYIMVNNFSTNNVGFDLIWGQQVIDNNLLDCSICDFTAFLPANQSFCQGESFSIPVQTSKGSGNFGYAWSSNSSEITVSGDSVLVVTPNADFSGPIVFDVVVTDQMVNNCKSEASVTMNIQANFELDPLIAPSVCPDETTEVELSGFPGINPTYTWDFGNAQYEGGDSTSMGPIQLSWLESGLQEVSVSVQLPGCPPVPFSFETEVLPEVETPEVYCPELTSDSTFTWQPVTGAVNYTVTWWVNGEQIGESDVSNTQFTVENALGDTVRVFVLANSMEGYCDGMSGMSDACFISDCEPPADFGIEGLEAIYCLDDAPLPLIGNPTGGIFTLAEDTISSFAPAIEGAGIHIIEYAYTDSTGCIFTDADTLTVLESIPAAFVFPDSVCTNEIAHLVYEGELQAGISYEWNIENGNPATIENQDSIEVIWGDAGTFNVTLTISFNDCILGTDNQEITILQSPIPPILTCDNSGDGTGSITWTAEDNHLYYYTAFLNGDSLHNGFIGTSTGNYTHPDSLANGDTLRLDVFAVIEGTSFCGESDTISLQCPISSCEDTPLSISGLAENYCLSDSTDLVEIIAEPSDGTLTIDSLSAAALTGTTFNIAVADTGIHTFTYTWEDADGCFNDTTFSTTIFDNPVASFSLSSQLVCENETVIVSYDGDAAIEDFEWNFGGMNAIPLANDAYELAATEAGTYFVELVVNQNGCASLPITDSIEVVAAPQTPLLFSCDNSVEGCITFTWEGSENDSLYQFNYVTTPLVGAPSIGSDTTYTASYTFCDLAEGTTVFISSLQAVGMFPCNNSASADTLTCTAIACGENLEITDLPTNTCADAAVIGFNFVAPDGASIDGNGVTQTGNSTASFDPATAGIGTHEIILSYSDPNTNCPTYADTVQIEVIEVPTANFSIAGNETVFCIGDEVDFSYIANSVNVDSYTWNFGLEANPPISVLANPPLVTYDSAGTKTITLEVENAGCSDEVSQEITILAPLATPVVTCGETSQTEVNFEWANIEGNVGYSISYTIDAEPAINDNLPMDSSSYTVSGLMPNQNVSITVIALGNEPCGDSAANSQNCVAQDCPVVNPVITNLDSEYCDDCGNPIVLTAEPTGGTFTLNADTLPITEFDPCGLSGTFTIHYEYQEGACPYFTSQEVTVNTRPSADIGLSDTAICRGDSIEVSFTGSAGADANYTWDFGANATPVNANTVGSHFVSWAVAGVKTITLDVEENNCAATTATAMIEVFDELNAPTITCTQSTQNSVGFTWSDVGGTGEYVYDLYINGILTESNQSTFDTSYDRDGLAPQDSVRIVLYAIGETVCGNSAVAEQTCIAEDCPPLAPTIDNIEAAYCQGVGTILLMATNTGGDGSGSGVFTLNGDTVTEFDTQISPNTYTIHYTYTQDSCSASTSHEVEIYALPEASIVALAEECVGEVVEVSFDGTADIGAVFEWDFGVGVLSSTEIAPNSWEVIWDSAGTKNIELSINSNGCEDETSIEVEIAAPLDAPDVSCMDVTTNEVTFEWTQVADAYHIQVWVNSSLVFEDLAYAEERYTALGLQAEDEVSIEVIPLGDAPCGNGAMGSANCRALECSLIDLSILMTNTSFCSDEEAIVLEANIEGGTFTIGENPTPINDFVPPSMEVGTHTIYYHYTHPETNCSYVDSLEVQVFDVPIAEFSIEPQACPNETLRLEFTGFAPNTSEAGFNWGDFAGADLVNEVETGVYELTWNEANSQLLSLEITTDEGCVSYTEQPIEVTEVRLDMPPTLTIHQGETVEIEVEASSSTSDIAAYTWGNSATLSCDDCPNPIASPPISMLYTLNIEDEDGCVELGSVLVEVILPDPLPELVFPNAFSPNGDGMNDVFRPVFNEMIVGLELQIYNRWGEKMFESTDRDAAWDGIYNRQLVPVGVYVYWAIVELADGSTQLVQGNLTVVY